MRSDTVQGQSIPLGAPVYRFDLQIHVLQSFALSMWFYSFFLWLLLVGETYSLYIREASLKHQATTQPCSETTETLFWHSAPDPAITNDVALEIPTTVTRACRDHSLVKRQARPPFKGKNIFSAICQRERTGQRMGRTQIVDVHLHINDGRMVRVPTPLGGDIFLRADQDLEHYNYPDTRQRQELEISIINSSPCPVSIEWLTRLRIYPEHDVGREGELLEPRSLDATPRENWLHEPNECTIFGLMPIQNSIYVAVRLLIQAFGPRVC